MNKVQTAKAAAWVGAAGQRAAGAGAGRGEEGPGGHRARSWSVARSASDHSAGPADEGAGCGAGQTPGAWGDLGEFPSTCIKATTL